MNEKIAVIGGGQMGSQIAALAAMAGYKTNIYDENKENLEYRYNFVEENIKNLIDKKIYSEDKFESFKDQSTVSETLESASSFDARDSSSSPDTPSTLTIQVVEL